MASEHVFENSKHHLEHTSDPQDIMPPISF